MNCEVARLNDKDTCKVRGMHQTNVSPGIEYPARASELKAEQIAEHTLDSDWNTRYGTRNNVVNSMQHAHGVQYTCTVQAAYEALAEMVSTLDASNVPLFLDCIGPSGIETVTEMLQHGTPYTDTVHRERTIRSRLHRPGPPVSNDGVTHSCACTRTHTQTHALSAHASVPALLHKRARACEMWQRRLTSRLEGSPLPACMPW